MAEADSLKVIIAGGGPAGSSCAISLERLAALAGRDVDVTLFEHKNFGAHYNQCMGVLSPPIESIMRDRLGLRLPTELIQKEIDGYWLHTDNRSILLEDPEDLEERSLATRRVFLDGYLLSQVQKAGVRIISSRLTDLEFSDSRVKIYSDSGSYEGDIFVGAFGLDSQMSEVLRRKTGYRVPDHLETVVTKIHPGQDLVDSFGRMIHAFLPSDPRMEFAALVPKGNHITAILAGKDVGSEHLHRFLDSRSCRKVMSFPFRIDDVFKGNFPISRARHFYGDRYIMIGDSAGLVRPFKGKGINIALLSGFYAARSILERGVSERALSAIENDFSEQVGDLWYGRAARWLTVNMARFDAFDPVLDLARGSATLRRVLYDSVSAHGTYHSIFQRLTSSPMLMARLALAVGRHFLHV